MSIPLESYDRKVLDGLNPERVRVIGTRLRELPATKWVSRLNLSGVPSESCPALWELSRTEPLAAQIIELGYEIESHSLCAGEYEYRDCADPDACPRYDYECLLESILEYVAHYLIPAPVYGRYRDGLAERLNEDTMRESGSVLL